MLVKNVLEFDSLYLEFDLNTVLSDIYVKCEQGEIVGLIGRNGSGKSCLMKIVFGTMKAYQQSVRINGNYILNTNISKGYIHYLPQQSFIPPSLNLVTIFYHYQLQLDDFLSYFPDFRGKERYSVSTFSGGELRLIELYIILKQKGLFCILDEPFSNLMPLHIEKVTELIQEAKQDKGILITDHLYRQLLPVCNRLYLLANGKTYPVKTADNLIQLGYLPG